MKPVPKSSDQVLNIGIRVWEGVLFTFKSYVLMKFKNVTKCRLFTFLILPERFKKSNFFQKSSGNRHFSGLFGGWYKMY